MSAFVVSNETMTRCARAICARNTYGQIVRRFDGLSTDADDAATQIGRRLFTLNIEAVFQRYPDTQDRPDQMPGTVDDRGRSTALRQAASFACRSSRTMVSADLVEALKALQCLRYQCSEGDVPETPLYRELGDAIAAVACEIVSRMPEYEKAPWG